MASRLGLRHMQMAPLLASVGAFICLVLLSAVLLEPPVA